ncbi:hypothetical protein LK10_06915 [Sinomonas humi]|uniref:Uncharacterized protein n=1 Tax=Sinomonas humi TaxID=1338436 RepID=A0A0B2AQN8_9MICC|nr:hypothetical protein LK10_06915 [Sinomonas humi]
MDRAVAADVRASLNEATGEVFLPMDKYWYSDRENTLVNEAVGYLIEDCVKASGHTIRPSRGYRKVFQDATYGQWSRVLAAKNGTEPVIRVVPGLTEGREYQVSAADDQATTECSLRVDRAGFPELLAGLGGDFSVQQRIHQVAQVLTERDPEYLRYRADWETCVAGKGLKVVDTWGIASGSNKEDDIRLALLDIECKESSGGARTPYDIVAQYQAAQMKDHQGELNALAEQKAAAVERARKVLREHGIADAKLNEVPNSKVYGLSDAKL